ncbi:Transmembrane and TPR repeat-containing protein 4 [Hondaea fermentalgiana]|uniref:Transmembrane and TPR repeat-containing protein 4 n=1 Tax=Hondaea fermentalgiana TaxID=2315210 RepID=A0A2R5GUV0_9STRA|nr:Transmembrane and TPR repeat-containing protein 4 [Hondaea fermentalgiana]|eukprot:GBG34099.1 Transmembrane and TPR repeat-containing protein 4 [Hondaea fermentalgiana]
MTSPMQARGRPLDKDDGDGPRWTFTAAALAALIAYCAMDDYGVLHGDFAVRDAAYILNNQVVQGGLDWKTSILTRDARGDPLGAPHSRQEFRPLTTLSFRANAIFSDEMDTYLYHLTNLVLHTSITFLVGLALGALVFGHDRFHATFAATIMFALHPIHVEAVANAAGRDELLMSFFYLCGMLWYARWTAEASLLKAVIGHLGAGTMMALSIFSKESGIMLSLALTIYELALTFKPRHVLGARMPQTMRNLSFIAVWTSVVFYLRTSYLGLDLVGAPVSPEDNIVGTARDDPMTLALSTSWIYCLYLQDLVYPDYKSYSADWSGESIVLVRSLGDPRCMFIGVFWAALTLLSIGALKLSPRSRHAWLIGFGSLTIPPFLMSSNIFFPAEHTKADRFLYLPSVGVCILFGVIFERLALLDARLGKYASRVLRSIVAVWCCAWVAAMYWRNTLWSSPLRVWELSLSNNPGSTPARINAARQMNQVGSLHAAEILLRPLIGMNSPPDVITLYSSVAADLGNCTFVTDILDASVGKANKELEEAIKDHPDDLAQERRNLSNMLTAYGVCMVLQDIPAAGKVLYSAAVADPTNAFALEQGSNLLRRVELIKMQNARQQQQVELQAQVKDLLKKSAPQVV